MHNLQLSWKSHLPQWLYTPLLEDKCESAIIQSVGWYEYLQGSQSKIHWSTCVSTNSLISLLRHFNPYFNSTINDYGGWQVSREKAVEDVNVTCWVLLFSFLFLIQWFLRKHPISVKFALIFFLSFTQFHQVIISYDLLLIAHTSFNLDGRKNSIIQMA